MDGRYDSALKSVAITINGKECHQTFKYGVERLFCFFKK